MERIHKIPVTFARSVTRKIKVEVEKLLDFELTTIQPPHKYSSGTVKVETIASITITGLVLLAIVITVMLVLNG